jgi:hypothetical protein
VLCTVVAYQLSLDRRLTTRAVELAGFVPSWIERPPLQIARGHFSAKVMIVIFVPDDVMALGLEFGSWGILPSRCVEGVGRRKFAVDLPPWD